MSQKSLSQFIRKQLLSPKINLRSLEKIACNNLRRFCSETNQSVESNTSAETQQGEQAGQENSNTDLQAAHPHKATDVQDPSPPSQQSKEQTDILNQQQQQKSESAERPRWQSDNNQRQKRTRRYENRGEQGGHQFGNSDLKVLRFENVCACAMRTDLQELCSAFGAEVPIENIVPEFLQPSFGVRRWWMRVTDAQKKLVLDSNQLDHFRLSERRLYVTADFVGNFNDGTFSTMGLSKSMGRYVVIHDLPLSAHEADVHRIFKQFNIAPNGVHIIQLDHLVRQSDQQLSRKKALVKFVDDLEANRAARVMHGKQINRNYTIQLTVLP